MLEEGCGFSGVGVVVVLRAQGEKLAGGVEQVCVSFAFGVGCSVHRVLPATEPSDWLGSWEHATSVKPGGASDSPPTFRNERTL